MPTISLTKPTPASVTFWFSLSLTCAFLIGLLGLRMAFIGDYVVQDDARQHVFWMQRFIDPDLFPNDVIADYFQSVAPLGYTWLYKGMAAIGIEPILLSKLLPVVLGVVVAGYCFGVSMQIFPVPVAGFLASFLLNQNLMMADDLSSATPRAFLYPLFLAFLYYFLRRSLLPCLVAIALQGLFYPQVMFISCGVLLVSLVRWQGKLPQLSRDRQDYVWCGAGLVVAAIVLIPFILRGGSEYGPVIKATEAMQMPEFWQSGRNSFFNKNPFTFWLFSERSGMLARPDRMFLPPLLLFGLSLPWLLRAPARFPLIQEVTANIRILGWTLVASVGLFFASHALLFKLHLPNRYTQHSFRIVLALATGIALTVLLDNFFRWVKAKLPARRPVLWGVMGLFVLLLVIYPVSNPLRKTYPWLRAIGNTLPGYIVGESKQLYQFFAQQPKDTVIASTLLEANNLPTFSYRSIVAAREYGIPYHTGYYHQFQTRTNDLIQAQYSLQPADVKAFTQKYGVDFWLIENRIFTPQYLEKSWVNQYQPVSRNAAIALQQGTPPVLQQAISHCTVLQVNNMLVLNAKCVAQEK